MSSTTTAKPIRRNLPVRLIVTVEWPNDQRSHAGPRMLKCNRDGLPAVAGAAG